MAPRRSDNPPREIIKHIKPADAYVSADMKVSSNEMTRAIRKPDAFVSGDISVSNNEIKKAYKRDDPLVSSDIPTAAEDDSNRFVIRQPVPVSNDIPVSDSEIKKAYKRDDPLVSSDIPTADNIQNKAIFKQPVPVSTDIVTSSETNDTVGKQIFGKPIGVSGEVKISPDEIKKQRKYTDANVNDKFPASEDIENKIVYKTPVKVNNEIPVAENIQNKFIVKQPTNIKTEMTVAPDEVKKTIFRKEAPVSTEIITAPDEVKKQHRKLFPAVSSEIQQSEEDIGLYNRFEDDLTGVWIPDSDPLKITEHNFSALQNFRYKNDGIEGVGGNTRINTTPLASAIKNGIHLKTNFDEESYVIVQTEYSGEQAQLWVNKTDIPDAGDFYNSETVTITQSVNDTIVFKSTYDDGTHDSGWIYLTLEPDYYTGSDFATELQSRMNGSDDLQRGGGGTAIINFTVSYDSSTKLFTITTDNELYKLQYSYEYSTCDSEMGLNDNVYSWTRPITSDTAIANADSLKLEDENASLARMSLLPDGHIGICDQKNNYIWAGDEIRCEALFTGKFNTVTINSSSDVLNFESSEGGPSTVDIDNGDYTCDELAEALQAKLNNNSTLTGGVINFTVESRMGRTYIDAGSGNTIELLLSGSEGPAMIAHGFTGGVSADQTIISQDFTSASPYIDDKKIADKTDRINNDLTDSSNIVTVNSKTAYEYILIGSRRPIKGFSVKIHTANTTESTMTVKYFNGVKYALVSNLSDGTSASSITLAQDGEVTFDDTDGSAKPAYHGGKYLYYYLVEISEGSAVITSITLNSAIQDFKDLWDGKRRIPIKASFADYLGPSQYKYIDYTNEMVKESYRYGDDEEFEGYRFIMKFGELSENVNDKIELMFAEKINAIGIELYTPEESATIDELSVECWDGESWVEATLSYTTDIDRTVATNKHFVKSGFIFFDIPEGTTESKFNKDNIVGYGYRIGYGLNGETLPTELAIDIIFGIPRYRTIENKYVFSFQYRNRAMWCNSISDKNYNRVDYSSKNTTEVYNGIDASGHENERSLYFGGAEPLTCATEVFNQSGSNLNSVALFFKYGETYLLTGDKPEDFAIMKISDNVGCPAFKSLVNAEVASKRGNSPEQNVVLWISDKGPMMYYNNSIVPVHGIENYFDPSSSNYIDKENIDKCAGWFDTTYKEWNVLLPVNTTDGTLDTWLVFDVLKEKWYEKTGETNMPQGGFQVEDSEGNKYIYAYDTSGYVYRVENSLTWSDGTTGITNVFESADILFNNSIWDEIELFYHKILFKDNDEGDITVEVYKNGNSTAETGTNLPSSETMAESDNYRYRNLITQLSSLIGTSFKFRTTVANCTETRPKILGWGVLYKRYREDITDKSDWNS